MFLCIILGYWWLTWCLAIILLFYFPIYYEIIAFGIFYDGIYGVRLPEFWNINYIFTIASIILFGISLLIKKRLTIYE
jgi:hypothetical protein